MFDGTAVSEPPADGIPGKVLVIKVGTGAPYDGRPGLGPSPGFLSGMAWVGSSDALLVDEVASSGLSERIESWESLDVGTGAKVLASDDWLD